MQVQNARRRGIAWNLTFEQWWRIWEKSGKWKYRGKNRGQYCMCRRGDKGPYSVRNVRIKTVSQNAMERTRERSEAFKQKTSKRMMGNKIWLGRHHNVKAKTAISRAHKERYRKNPNARANVSRWMKARWERWKAERRAARNR